MNSSCVKDNWPNYPLSKTSNDLHEEIDLEAGIRS